MVKRLKLIIAILTISIKLFSQNNNDSIVMFSDFIYHSDFEKGAIANFLTNKTDTFNLLLAIDKDIDKEKSSIYLKIYQSIYPEFERQKVYSKDLDKKIKLVNTIIRDKFLKRYTKIEFVPFTFQNGSFNCVSASILYSLIFNQLKIPYDIMVTSNHVFIIANPGKNQIEIETSSPGVIKATFKQDFSDEFSQYIKQSELISNDEYSLKTVEEIQIDNLEKAKKAEFFNLPGFQYYNLALSHVMIDELEEAYHLMQKAYFFYPAKEVRLFLHSALLIVIQDCSFTKVSDIDYLGQLARFNDNNLYIIPQIFKNIISYHIENKNKVGYCDSLYNRLLPQISDKKIKDDIEFVYYDKLSSISHNSEKLEYYAYNALKIKPDNRDALENFELSIQKKYDQIHDPKQLLDSVQILRQKYDLEVVKPIFDNYEMIANMGFAFENYKSKNPESGELFIKKFEQTCTLPITNRELQIKIVDAYRIKAEYYSSINKAKEKEALSKGLYYVPNSSLLKSIMEEKGYKY